MKKLLLLSVFALLFSIFSCSPDEIETQPTKKIEKTFNPLEETGSGGPGDGPIIPPPPPK